MTQTIYHNGNWVEDGPILTLDDRGLRGDGVFDTLLITCEGGKTTLHHADRHFQRLKHNAHIMEIAPHPDAPQLEKIANELSERNNLGDGRYALNTLITRGTGPRGLMPPAPEDTHPTVTMRLAPVPGDTPPINAIIARRFRRNEGSPLSQVKSLNYGDNILALIEARHKNANEALIMNNAGNIICSTSGNLFAVLNGILFTPPLSDGILDGITRQVLMEKYPVIESSLSMQDLDKAQGLFITNSIKGCRPIQTLNGRELPPPSIDIDQDFHIS